MDELASFDALTDMSTSVAKLRKYGGCVLSATQNLNQLNNIYGHFVTKAMLDQFRTKFFFSSSNMGQDILTSCFGDTEIRRDHESISFGTHEMRDGVNISKSIVTRPLVTSSDIFALKPLECYVALPDPDIRCAKIKVPFIPPEKAKKEEPIS